MYSSKIVSLCFLVAIVFGCVVAHEERSASAVSFQVYESASVYWLAIQPQNDNGATVMVELKDGTSSATFVTMAPNAGWGFYTLTCLAGTGFTTPLTLRFTSSSGSQIVAQLNTVTPNATVSTGLQYVSAAAPTVAATPASPVAGKPASTVAPTHAPTVAATLAPTAAATRAPTVAATRAPTVAATRAPTVAATHAPTVAATRAPASNAPPAPTVAATPVPTVAATPVPTVAATPAPPASATPPPAVTAKPTTAPTTAPIIDLCEVVPTSVEPTKLLVPLYVYPGAAWDQLIASAALNDIVAIINPSSGPLSTVDSSYKSYMTKLNNAGIVMIGYVHTSYGTRAWSDVQKDIDTWVANYPLITGIFLDEGASSAIELPYYSVAYNYIMSQPNYNQVIVNPGVQPDQGYLAVSTSIVIFENVAAALPTTQFSPWVSCAPNAAEKAGYKYKFSFIANSAGTASAPALFASMQAMGAGLVYVTDGPAGCCTYNSLVSFFANEAASLSALN